MNTEIMNMISNTNEVNLDFILPELNNKEYSELYFEYETKHIPYHLMNNTDMTNQFKRKMPTMKVLKGKMEIFKKYQRM